MIADYEIPLTSIPQTFAAVLPNGLTYNFRLIFQFTPNPCWILDIADATNQPLVCGIPLITGADLLAQYEYLGLSCKMWCATDGAPDTVPTSYNLGSGSHLYIEG